MADFAALKILSVLTGGLSGEPELHPRVTFPMNQTESQRYEELYGECDRPFLKIGDFRKDVVPLGIYQRHWVVDEKSREGGVIPGYVQSTAREGFETFKSKADGLYKSTVSPIDQELIQIAGNLYGYGVQGYNYFQDLRRYAFGSFQLAQGDFFAKIERRDYLRALRQANRLADVGFDRLRGHVYRLEAVKQARFITKDDKNKIEGAMGQFLVNSEKQLFFWWGRSLELRSLYDLMHHLVDDCGVILYQQNTGGLKNSFKAQYWIWTLDSLYLELQASFHHESCQERVNFGGVSKVFEEVLNSAALLFSNDGEVPRPRSFQDVVKEAQKRIKEDYESLKPYEENPKSSEKDKLDRFYEAITKDHFFRAKQVGINGQLEGGKHSWEEELNRLDCYKNLLTTLFQIQDELFVLKFKIAHHLKNVQNDDLAKLFETIDEAEYKAYQERFALKYAYLKEIQGSINSLSGILNQLKTSTKERVRSYLFTGELFDRASSFREVVGEIRSRIKNYTGYMREAKIVLGEEQATLVVQAAEFPPSFVSQDVPLLREESTSKSSSTVKDTESPIVQPLSPTLSRDLTTIDVIDLQAYQRFYTPQEYNDFVGTEEFEEELRIGPAILNCAENCKTEIAHWNWEREKAELEKYRQTMQRIAAIKGLSESYKLDLQGDLLASFRKKVVTDYSAYVYQTTQWFATKIVGSSANLLSRSGNRKLKRVIEGRSPINSADNFRDPKFQILFAARLGWKGVGLVPIDEASITPEQKIFTIDNYKSYIESYKFEVEPHIAMVIIQFQALNKADTGPAWDWVREAQDLKRYCEIFESLEGRDDSELVGGLVKDLCESFRKKLVTDYSAYTYNASSTYLQQGTVAVSSFYNSILRKGARILHAQSPLNSAGDFRDPAFLTRFHVKEEKEEK